MCHFWLLQIGVGFQRNIPVLGNNISKISLFAKFVTVNMKVSQILGFESCPPCSILNARKHVSKIWCVSFLKWRGKAPTLLGPQEGTNSIHLATCIITATTISIPGARPRRRALTVKYARHLWHNMHRRGTAVEMKAQISATNIVKESSPRKLTYSIEWRISENYSLPSASAICGVTSQHSRLKNYRKLRNNFHVISISVSLLPCYP
jgi:hypothetical protein